MAMEITKLRSAVENSVRNKTLLAVYLIVFTSLVLNYDLYRDNTWLVFLATAIILIGGLIAWIVSIRGSRES